MMDKVDVSLQNKMAAFQTAYEDELEAKKIQQTFPMVV